MLVNRKRLSARAGLVTGALGLITTFTLAYGVEKTARAVVDEMPNGGTVIVDARIQKIATRVLRDSINAQDADEGFAIVADPQTGRILAVANIDTKDRKKGYWALSQLLEPASIAKGLVVAEALELGKTTPTQEHNCENGNYSFGGRVFHDWKTEGFSKLTTTATVAHSSDICTVKIAEKIGLEGIHTLLDKYGFGPGGTASAFPEARVGQTPPRNGPLGEFLVPFIAFGQGFRSTALELVQAYGAIANGGELLMPIAANAPASKRKVVRRVMAPNVAQEMRGILQDVVLTGTGRTNASSYIYTTAGKTASFFSPDDTWIEDSRGTRRANMAGFIGFAPVNNPKVVVYVAIRGPKRSLSEGKGGAHGSEHAAPVFKKIVEAVLQEMKVAPDNL